MRYAIPEEYLLSMMRAGQDAMMKFGQACLAGAARDVPPTGSIAALSARTAKLSALQQGYLQQLAALWSGVLARHVGVVQDPPVAAGGKADRRFAGSPWREHAFHGLLKQLYLLHARFLTDLIDAVDADERTRGRLRFFARQYLDAMSPANFLATNPEALELAFETRGASLAEGLSNLVEDMQKGRISITDESAFEVGVNLGLTPGAVVFENELIQLLQYAPLTDTVGSRPLLIVPPCINRFYVLDLQPENSFVRYAVQQGHTVFLVSWRNVGEEQAHLTWDDYLELGVLQGIDTALAISGAERLNVLGFCVGGTLLGCALAVLRARDEDKVASLTLLTTMLDFCDSGEIGLLIDETSVALRESTIGRRGIFEGRELAFVFSTLRGNDLIWPYVVSNYLKGATPDAFDLLYWNADSANLAGPMYAWYVRNAYLENNLRVPGKTVQCGEAIDLGTIDVPAYVFAAREDHIVPWKTAYASVGLLGGQTRFVLGASGHIAGVINPAARNKRNYWIDGEVGSDPGSDPDRWLASAIAVPGSWWPHWGAWLAGHAGDPVAARSALGNVQYPVREAAPGRYVRERVPEAH